MMTATRIKKFTLSRSTNSGSYFHRITFEPLACDRVRIAEVIQDGRAYLDTFVGRRRVISYDDRTGDCTTLNPGEDRFFGQRTFMVGIESIKIEPAAAG